MAEDSLEQEVECAVVRLRMGLPVTAGQREFLASLVGMDQSPHQRRLAEGFKAVDRR